MDPSVASLPAILAVVAAAGSISSVLGTLGSLLARRRDLAATRSALEESRSLGAALEEGGVRAIGDFLGGTLGDVTLVEYVDDPAIARRVDRYVSQIVGYFGSEKDVSVQAEEAEAAVKARGESILRSMAPVEASPDVDLPSPWSRLAGLRLEIEFNLKRSLGSLGIETPEFVSATRLVRIAQEAGFLHDLVAEDLLYAVAAANRAIHGHDPSEVEVSEATFLGRRALAALDEGQAGPAGQPYGV